MIRNYCGKVISEGGRLTALIIPSEQTGGTGLMNPSILVDNDELLINVRHTNYALYHNEGRQTFYSIYGPLVYMNPENDQHLKTNNFICRVDEKLNLKDIKMIDTSKFADQLVYAAEFHGLEDGRLVRWGDKLLICGVRRDTENHPVGRFELAVLEDDTYVEIERCRIEPPKEGSFCEKNWMPILDMPYCFVKWTNPLEIVKVDMKKGTSETIILKHELYPGIGDIRGGSQVITVGEYRTCIVHEVNLKTTITGKKDAKYVHRFVIWDKEWNVVKYSEPFSFLNGEIEFSCGMVIHKQKVYVTFGFQDNAAYILEIPLSSFYSYLGMNLTEEPVPDEFSPLYYMSAESSVQRQESIGKQIKLLNLMKTTPVIATSEMDESIVVKGRFIDTLDKQTILAITSHLRAIKLWLRSSDSSYGIFVEDDVDLSIMSNWSFTWDEFVKALPVNWDCIQMSVVRENLDEVVLKLRQWDDWSCTAYMLRREYAEKLIQQYYPEEEFILDIPNMELQPLLENLLYVPGYTYTIPLFAENVKFKTTSDTVDDHKKNHVESARFVTVWWNTWGKDTPLDFLMVGKKAFDWGENLPEDVEVIDYEVFTQRVYELVQEVKQGDVVVDIGANVGAFTRSILNKRPSQVYCIEPSEKLLATLTKNISGSNVTYINKGIGVATDSAKPLTSNDKVFVPSGDTFETITFSQLIKEHQIEKIDFLKIDCEGAEYYIFTSKNKSYILNHVGHIAAEFHLATAEQVKKFISFRDLYLKASKSFKVLSSFNMYNHDDLSEQVFSDKYLTDYSQDHGTSAQLMIYITNDIKTNKS